MKIKQWENKNLSHFSYGILSEADSKVVLIDPARDVKPYLQWAEDHNASIVAVIETHPHADFVSSHGELNQMHGATIYVHSSVGAAYPFEAFDDGATLTFSDFTLTSLHTPGHSPDSISILLEAGGKQHSVFTGDTLFIGDCGRPDLREGAGKIQSKREELARQMYHSLRGKLATLDDHVIVYPAHGAGTLCGKSLKKENSSTIGNEKMGNWCFQKATEEEFISNILSDQPFVPAYFAYDVELNRQGAPILQKCLSEVVIADQTPPIGDGCWIIDVRDQAQFKKSHLPKALNLMENGKFETWLGSIIKPGEKFFLTGSSKEQLERLVARVADIGYEPQIISAFVFEGDGKREETFDSAEFERHRDKYTIVDVRNVSEVKQRKIFEESIAIPLSDLRERVNEIPTHKPVVVHCAGGYRSAAGASLLSTLKPELDVIDMGESIKSYS